MIFLGPLQALFLKKPAWYSAPMHTRSEVAAISRWVVLAALFVIPFLVLYVSNSLFFPFITGKGFAFRILVEAAAAAWSDPPSATAKLRPAAPIIT